MKLTGAAMAVNYLLTTRGWQKWLESSSNAPRHVFFGISPQQASATWDLDFTAPNAITAPACTLTMCYNAATPYPHVLTVWLPIVNIIVANAWNRWYPLASSSAVIS